MNGNWQVFAKSVAVMTKNDHDYSMKEGGQMAPILIFLPIRAAARPEPCHSRSLVQLCRCGELRVQSVVCTGYGVSSDQEQEHSPSSCTHTRHHQLPLGRENIPRSAARHSECYLLRLCVFSRYYTTLVSTNSV